MTSRVDEFNGHPVIALLRNDDDEYPFTFGVGKARLVLENLKAIQKFVKDNPTQGRHAPLRPER